MADGHIILQDVRKSFGSKHVLNGINLSVPKGHSLVVIGGSGTGKSVMLKCILGILRADAGSPADLGPVPDTAARPDRHLVL